MMSPDSSEMPAPDHLLVFEARQAVIRRGRRPGVWPARAASILSSLLGGFRLQHLGVAVLLITSGWFYVSELSDHPGDAGSSAYGGSSLIIATNNTISVISSTMLTSIPTLRN